MRKRDFELCLFSTDPNLIAQVTEHGVETIIVDWENKNKKERQQGYDTEINCHTKEDLIAARAASSRNLICRINAIDEDSKEEISSATQLGADEILIPMVRSTEEVKWALDYIENRASVGILIETNEAIACAEKLATLPLKRVYVGLNDLAIQNKSSSIFAPLTTDILKQLRNTFSCAFGFGGVTLPDHGFPIPASLLMAELVRLECDFSFLRRSFLKDIQGKSLPLEMARIHSAFQSLKERSSLEVDADHRKLVSIIDSLMSYSYGTT